ncbi:uncharacterized protein LOC110023107 isoform X1 [Phalaenopsis equestris]|uniref:uncharacterized protein LOC110023107 isoform X1 n=1 Tax=Phalaenopsis equestris TaxID=78828 RepID=UPI0009E270BA|nr:uncharacterized protein LOC110023107 isoform X1 [Phalaenopsis equestris]XP_020578003.1 uncharacterized protein LOC110023107 isoform X1 [Phalaenopsis equestris]XP_020578004.1 uncharacterized protein LOC110023107 isoform X1 [Phalaenopsis equestris]
MEKIKISGSVKEECNTKVLECSCDSNCSPRVPDSYLWRSFSEGPDDLLNETPRLSYYNPSLHLNLERRLGNQPSFQNMTSSFSSAKSTLSNESSAPMTATELVNEITTLELEIVHLEQHLLSLYRTAFDYYKNDDLNISSDDSRHTSGGMLTRKRTKQTVNHGKIGLKSDRSIGETNYSFKSTEQDIAMKPWLNEIYCAHNLKCDSNNIAGHFLSHNPQKV